MTTTLITIYSLATLIALVPASAVVLLACELVLAFLFVPSLAIHDSEVSEQASECEVVLRALARHGAKSAKFDSMYSGELSAQALALSLAIAASRDSEGGKLTPRALGLVAKSSLDLASELTGLAIALGAQVFELSEGSLRLACPSLSSSDARHTWRRSERAVRFTPLAQEAFERVLSEARDSYETAALLAWKSVSRSPSERTPHMSLYERETVVA